MDTKKIFANIEITLTNAASDKILHHIFANPLSECGGYLIGVVNEQDDAIFATIEDVYIIESAGADASFKFSSQSGLEAYNYCLRCNEYNPIQYKIIGNYHSHGRYKAFFSKIDENMMRQSVAPEVYMVFSPAFYQFTALYKDKFFRLYMSNCKFDMPGFNYIPPYLDSKIGWKLYNSKVNFEELSKVLPKENLPFHIEKENQRTEKQKARDPLLSEHKEFELKIEDNDIAAKEQRINGYYTFFLRLNDEMQRHLNDLGCLEYHQDGRISELWSYALKNIEQLRNEMISYGCLLSKKISNEFLECEKIFSEISYRIKGYHLY